jgi:di/tricarboxylate transporter
MPLASQQCIWLYDNLFVLSNGFQKSNLMARRGRIGKSDEGV